MEEQFKSLVPVGSVEEGEEVCGRLDQPLPRFGKHLHLGQGLNCSRLAQNYLVEDVPINIVGKVDVQEGFLLVVQLQSQGGSHIGHTVHHIQGYHIGGAEGVALVVDAGQTQFERNTAQGQGR